MYLNYLYRITLALFSFALEPAFTFNFVLSALFLISAYLSSLIIIQSIKSVKIPGYLLFILPILHLGTSSGRSGSNQ